jgi:hypothetical protein
LLKQIPEAFNVVEEVFTEAQPDFMEARLHEVRRLLTPRCGTAVFHPSTRRRCGRAVSHPFIGRQCEHTAVDQFIQANAIPRLECVRHHRPRSGGLTLIRIEVRSRVRARTRLQVSREPIVSHHSRIAETQLSQACGTGETPEPRCGMEIISEMQTIFGMETISGTQTICETTTIIFVMAGKTTFSRSAQGIGIATGTVTAIIGGMVTDAASLTARG